MRTMALLTLLLTTWGAAQTKPPVPRFAVVSIHQQPHGFYTQGRRPGLVYPGGKYINRQATLWTLVAFAYPECVFPNKTLVGLPNWAYDGSLVWDVEAEPSPGMAPGLDEMRQMMAAALADRFQMKYHFVNQRMPVEFVERDGPALLHTHVSAPGQQSLQLLIGPAGVYGRGATMGELARKLTTFLYSEGRPAVDHTGLTGFYDMDGPAAENAGPGTDTIRQLLRSLGLKLVKGEAVVKVLVVDHVSRPTPN